MWPHHSCSHILDLLKSLSNVQGGALFSNVHIFNRIFECLRRLKEVTDLQEVIKDDRILAERFMLTLWLILEGFSLHG